MITRPHEMLARDVRNWAADQLGLAGNPSAEEARAALLRQVQRDAGVPPPGAGPAFQVLTAPPDKPLTRVPDQALQDLETGLYQDLDAFAEVFFSLDIPERSRRWADLKRRGSWLGPVQARLEHLRKGLAIDFRKLNGLNGRAGKLAQYLAELFVLRNQARAARRQELFQEFREEFTDWERAARVLQNRFPSLVRLDPELVRQLANPGAVKAEQAEARRLMRQSTANTSPQGGGISRIWFVIAIAIFVLFRLLMGLGNYSSTPKPAWNQPEWQNWKNIKLQDEMDKLRKAKKNFLPDPWNNPNKRPPIEAPEKKNPE